MHYYISILLLCLSLSACAGQNVEIEPKGEVVIGIGTGRR